MLREIYPAQKRFMDYYAQTIPASNDYMKIIGGNLNDYQPPGGAANQAVINHQLYYYFADYMARIGTLLGRDRGRGDVPRAGRRHPARRSSPSTGTRRRTRSPRRRSTTSRPRTRWASPTTWSRARTCPASDPRYLAGEQTAGANKRSVAAVIANDIVVADEPLRRRHLRPALPLRHPQRLRLQGRRLPDGDPGHQPELGRPDRPRQHGADRELGRRHRQPPLHVSSVLTWFYQDAGGIRPASPGYRTVTVKPFVPTVAGTSEVPTSVNQTGLAQSLLDNVDVSLQTARGKVTSKWWRRDDGRDRDDRQGPVQHADRDLGADVGQAGRRAAERDASCATTRRHRAVRGLLGRRAATRTCSTCRPRRGGDGRRHGAGDAVADARARRRRSARSRRASDRNYDASTTATVISTAGDATLSVTDPASNATGRLVNGTFALSEPLQARANTGAFAPLSTTAGSPLALLTYTGPVSNDVVTIGFRQHIAANQALRTGAYSKTLTFTLSTTTP